MVAIFLSKDNGIKSGTVQINLDSLEDFYLKLGQRMQEAEDQIGAKVSGLKAASYLPLASTVKAEASAIFNEYAQHSLFGVIYGASYEKYLSNPNVTNAKKLFKISDVEGLMAAYKLFYVGCSRARTSLDVIIDSGALEDVEATRVKFMKLGFSVEIHQ